MTRGGDVRGGRLADDDLVERYTVRGELEDGGVRPLAGRGCQKAGASRVFAGAL
jgi:hypothetical protein